MGVLLFLLLHRLVVFVYLLMVVYGVAHFGSADSYTQFLAVDYLTMLFALLCGSWYGIWVGSYWYEQVYESGMFRGIFSHAKQKLFPFSKSRYQLKEKVEAVRERLEQDLSQMESLAEQLPQNFAEPEPVKRPLVRKRAVKRTRKTSKTV